MNCLFFVCFILIFLLLLFACVDNKRAAAVRAGDVYLSFVTRKSQHLFAFFAFDEFVRLSLGKFAFLKYKLLFYFACKFQPRRVF